MSFILTYLLAFALGCLAQIALSAEPHTDLPKALAKAHSKPVFIYVYDSI
ncbi:MAG: hypothetical protein OSB29_01380 [Verrucomicrobiota bacterium]|nr:hypothetical protein [Verrucomicrobiota bacterium]